MKETALQVLKQRGKTKNRNRLLSCGFFLPVSLILLMLGRGFAQIAGMQPAELQKIDVVENLGQKIPLDLTFTNERGEVFRLGDYFHQGKPVIIALAYYNCPMLCSLVLNGLTASARQIDFQPGKDYTILTVSIEPRETAELAAAKKKNYLESLGIAGADAGWIFCVGDSSQSRALANALGFNYYWDEKQQMWAHPAVLHVLAPDGTISRYLYGLDYKPQDVRLSLLEASKGRIGNTIDRIVLYCFHYDPAAKGYVVFAQNVMKIGGLATILILGLFLGILGRRYRVIKPINFKNERV